LYHAVPLYELQDSILLTRATTYIGLSVVSNTVLVFYLKDNKMIPS
jgi:hypothetical protein